MARKLVKVNLKKVIDALRDGPKTYTELKKLNIAEKSLSTILKEYLEYWGLAIKFEDGRWGWFERKKDYKNRDEYEIFLKHSKKLILPLKALLATDDLGFKLDVLSRDLENVRRIDEAKSWTKYAEEHIKTGYPDVYNALVEFRNLDSKRRTTLDGSDTKTINEERIAAYRELATKVGFIIRKIENEEPLWGSCQLCPRIDIEDTS